ncbi:MAG: glutaredoxin 3 [Porticoccus sp.]|nr:glutaredoxin 3 [Porticoccus sp.]MBQ0806502.1 glutaredoxin 3 [Porticoccus sp.]MDX2350138.1 glutaredoxin 3 [Porticoccus sp.]
MAKVTVYTTRSCGYCVAAKKLLTKKGVKYSEVTVDSDPAMRRKLITLSGRHTVPQIWVGETHVGGSDDLHRLDLSGQLDVLIAASL